MRLTGNSALETHGEAGVVEVSQERQQRTQPAMLPPEAQALWVSLALAQPPALAYLPLLLALVWLLVLLAQQLVRGPVLALVPSLLA